MALPVLPRIVARESQRPAHCIEEAVPPGVRGFMVRYRGRLILQGWCSWLELDKQEGLRVGNVEYYGFWLWSGFSGRGRHVNNLRKGPMTDEVMLNLPLLG